MRSETYYRDHWVEIDDERLSTYDSMFEVASAHGSAHRGRRRSAWGVRTGLWLRTRWHVHGTR